MFQIVLYFKRTDWNNSTEIKKETDSYLKNYSKKDTILKQFDPDNVDTNNSGKGSSNVFSFFKKLSKTLTKTRLISPRGIEEEVINIETLNLKTEGHNRSYPVQESLAASLKLNDTGCSGDPTFLLLEGLSEMCVQHCKRVDGILMLILHSKSWKDLSTKQKVSSVDGGQHQS